MARLLPTVAWCAEIIVVDMQSEDRTADLARAAGARVISTPMHPRVDAIRTQYLDEVRTEWVLVMDGDEYLSADAATVMERLAREHGAQYDAFAFPRFNQIGEHVMRGSGWYPDHHIRLFRPASVRWPDATHRAPEVVTGSHRLMVMPAEGGVHVHHDNYVNLREFIERQLRYALHDYYDPDPAAFDAHEYVTRAYQEFARRHEPSRDGDLSKALAAVMAWDQIMRAVIHWDQLEPKPTLESFFTLPVAVRERDAKLEHQLADALAQIAALERHRDALLNTRIMKLCHWLDGLRGRKTG